MAKEGLTDHYTVAVTIDIVPRNSYGDPLATNVISYTGKTKAKGLGDLGQLLERIQAAIDE
jgi:hypothetical protein